MQGRNRASRQLTPLATVTAPARRGATRLFVANTAPFTQGGWYKLCLRQYPFPPPSPPPSPPPPAAPVAFPVGGRRRMQATATPPATDPLVQRLSDVFSNKVLEARAAQAAEQTWGIVPPGTLAAAGIPTPAAATAAAAAAGARPLPPLLAIAAEYAPALMYTHWLEDGDVPPPAPSGPSAAMAAFGSLDAYLCKWPALCSSRPAAAEAGWAPHTAA